LRLAATSELNLTSSRVTGCGEAKGRGYWAATLLKSGSVRELIAASGHNNPKKWWLRLDLK